MRPENWINPYKEWDDWQNIDNIAIYEAGADAILDLLKKEGEYVHNEDSRDSGLLLARTIEPGQKGWFVFIEE